MKRIRTEEALGQILCHDVTEIVPGKAKGPRFKKGHVVREEDIPVLLRLGKEHLYLIEANENVLHENDAAEILRAICQNENMRATEPSEGKIELVAEIGGLFLADTDLLRSINALGEIIIATRPSGFPVKKGDKLCGTRVIPLVIEKEKMAYAKKAAGNEPLLRLLPIMPRKYGLIITGGEVAKGRLEDKFSPVVKAKLAEYGCELIAHRILGDDHIAIAEAIREMPAMGAELVLCTGGMSVDPDDRTPLAIKNAAETVVSYGAPVLPGAMFMLAYTANNTPVCGLPGCVMYAKRTIFDIVLPYLLAGEPVSANWLAGLGNGGLCLNCEDCRYPNCMFGKGV